MQIQKTIRISIACLAACALLADGPSAQAGGGTVPPDPETGACCLAAQGIVSALDITAAECKALGGVFHGPGTGSELPDICLGQRPDPKPDPTGVCCITVDGFTYGIGTSAELCEILGGVFFGPGEGGKLPPGTCVEQPKPDPDPDPDPNPDPDPKTGACCISGGGLIGGVDVTAEVCEALGGVFQGVGTGGILLDLCPTPDPNPDPKPKPAGACCITSVDGFTYAIGTSAFLCEVLGGVFQGPGADGKVPSICSADVYSDGAIDGKDLGLLLGAWGQCATQPCLADLNIDEVVNGLDLAMLLGEWGPVP